jgi:hypothetical protein
VRDAGVNLNAFASRAAGRELPAPPNLGHGFLAGQTHPPALASESMSNWRHLAQRSMASSFMDIVKMKSFVPCDVEAPLTGYKAKIIQVVFDPLRME